MTTAHTPTPWRSEQSIVGDYTGFDLICAAPANKRWIASVHSKHTINGKESPELATKKAKEIQEAAANAAHIVQCVNAHSALIAALEECLANGGWIAASVVDRARAALALAKGQP